MTFNLFLYCADTGNHQIFETYIKPAESGTYSIRFNFCEVIEVGGETAIYPFTNNGDTISSGFSTSVETGNQVSNITFSNLVQDQYYYIQIRVRVTGGWGGHWINTTESYNGQTAVTGTASSFYYPQVIGSAPHSLTASCPQFYEPDSNSECIDVIGDGFRVGDEV